MFAKFKLSINGIDDKMNEHLRKLEDSIDLKFKELKIECKNKEV